MCIIHVQSIYKHKTVTNEWWKSTIFQRQLSCILYGHILTILRNLIVFSSVWHEITIFYWAIDKEFDKKIQHLFTSAFCFVLEILKHDLKSTLGYDINGSYCILCTFKSHSLRKRHKYKWSKFYWSK